MKHEFSAGGIVFKKEADELLILLAQHSYHHGWVFPKGLIGDHIAGEGKEATAIREVEEETGVLGKILQPVRSINYWFVFEGEKRKKTVYYYIMECIKEDITKHDHEMEAVEWLPIGEVEKRLTFKTDRKIWRETKELLTNNF
jgi:8-oxo-dGTP diphosphatase